MLMRNERSWTSLLSQFTPYLTWPILEAESWHQQDTAGPWSSRCCMGAQWHGFHCFLHPALGALGAVWQFQAISDRLWKPNMLHIASLSPASFAQWFGHPNHAAVFKDWPWPRMCVPCTTFFGGLFLRNKWWPACSLLAAPSASFFMTFALLFKPSCSGRGEKTIWIKRRNAACRNWTRLMTISITVALSLC